MAESAPGKDLSFDRVIIDNDRATTERLHYLRV